MDLHKRWLAPCPGISIRAENGNRLLKGQYIAYFGNFGEGIKKALFNRARVAKHVSKIVGNKLAKECFVTVHNVTYQP